MAGEAEVVREVAWREVLPGVHLFRSFRIAVHPSKLALAWVLLLLLYIGGRAMDGLWPSRYLPPKIERIDRYVIPASMDDGQRLVVDEVFPTSEREGIFIKFFQYEAGQADMIAAGVLGWNWTGSSGVAEGVVDFIFVGPVWLFHSHPLYAAIITLWFLILWAIFGGAIARIAAVHACREEKMSVRQALRFSTGKILSYLFAPIIPLLIVLVLGVVLAVSGWVLLHIPYIGPIVLGVMFFLALIIGFVMTLVLLGTAAGFNLMYPTIAVEGSDSFDAISRSFSYVYARPWKLLWYTAIALVYGAICYLFVRLFIFVMLATTRYFIGWWLGGQPGAYWNGTNLPDHATIWAPMEFWNLSDPIKFSNLKWSEQVAAAGISFWVYTIITMLGAFAISFYFSATTIIYGLLRREVDATEMDDVYMEESEEEFSEAPPATPEKLAPSADTPITPPANEPPAA